MGLTTESLHIRTDSSPADALTRLLAKEGFEPCEQAQTQRTIFILPGDGWQTVMDSVIFQGATLARQLSKTAEVVSMRVEDSDISAVTFYREGKKQTAPGAIADLLKAKTLFAEAKLATVARELGIDPHNCTCTLEDLMEAPPREAIRLDFRSGVALPTGPPAFQIIFPPYAHPLLPDGPIEPLAVSIRNNGANATGIRVVVKGDALTRGLVRIDRIQLGRLSKNKLPELRKLDPVREDGVTTAEAPDFVLPGMPKFTGKAANSVAIVNAAFRASTLSVSLFGKALQAGESYLEISIVPIENEAGAASIKAVLKIG